jgi:hypothetical protein
LVKIKNKKVRGKVAHRSFRGRKKTTGLCHFSGKNYFNYKKCEIDAMG